MPFGIRKHFPCLTASCNWLLHSWSLFLVFMEFVLVGLGPSRSFSWLSWVSQEGIIESDKRAKIQEGCCFYCFRSCPNLLVVPLFLYTFTCRMGCVVPHAALWNKMSAFRIWSLLASNLFSSAVKITFVAIKLVPNGHLLFLLCSYQAAGHESAQLKIF